VGSKLDNLFCSLQIPHRFHSRVNDLVGKRHAASEIRGSENPSPFRELEHSGSAGKGTRSPKPAEGQWDARASWETFQWGRWFFVILGGVFYVLGFFFCHFLAFLCCFVKHSVSGM